MLASPAGIARTAAASEESPGSECCAACLRSATLAPRCSSQDPGTTGAVEIVHRKNGLEIRNRIIVVCQIVLKSGQASWKV